MAARNAAFSLPSVRQCYKFTTGGGWKVFIIGHGKQGCATNEVVANNGYYNGYPNFYYRCNSKGVWVRNPLGNNNLQYDHQPGGDTQCLRGNAVGVLPCARFVADQWVTYLVHVSALTKHLEVWQCVDGTPTKLTDFHLKHLPDDAQWEWLMLTPYNTNKRRSETHPDFRFWHRRVIVSTRPIAPPAD